MPGTEDRLLRGFEVFDVSDPREMDRASRVTRRFPTYHNVHGFSLRDPALRDFSCYQWLSRFALRRAGELMLTHVVDRFATSGRINDPGLDQYCFGQMAAGGMSLGLPGRPDPISLSGTAGIVYRAHAGVRVLTDGANRRMNLWVAAPRLETSLREMLGDDLHDRLEFTPEFDCADDNARLLGRLVYMLAEDLADDATLVANEFARAPFTDLVVQTILHRLPHNYSGRIARLSAPAVPRHLRRAEAFMLGHLDCPIGLTEMAAAAGCSLRTLQSAFRSFRGVTPIAALQQARLVQARADLRQGADTATARAVAVRYGFTNTGRFAAAYKRHFGEFPSETIRLSRGA